LLLGEFSWSHHVFKLFSLAELVSRLFDTDLKINKHRKTYDTG
jgi:hypothetical protein